MAATKRDVELARRWVKGEADAIEVGTKQIILGLLAYIDQLEAKPAHPVRDPRLEKQAR